LHDTTPDRISEGPIKRGVVVTLRSIQHQVERSGSGSVMALLPILQGVSPETPKFWGARCNLEPMVANEEEVIRALS